MTFEDHAVPSVGTYVIESDGSQCLYIREQYVGTPDPIVVKRVGKNGTECRTPTVNSVTPTSTNAESTGVQAKPQKGTQVSGWHPLTDR